MRVKIEIDSASTREVRALSAALYRVTGNGDLTLRVEGPECWGGTTGHLTRAEAADVMSQTWADHPRAAEVPS